MPGGPFRLTGDLFFKVLNVNYKLVKAKVFQFLKPSTQVRGCAGARKVLTKFLTCFSRRKLEPAMKIKTISKRSCIGSQFSDNLRFAGRLLLLWKQESP